jgi:phenylacetate-coenzyme A ligase PaaK-like adenylate-forming protein
VEIDTTQALTSLKITVEPVGGVEGTALAARIDHTIRAELLFRAEVQAVAPGSLPRSEMKSRRWLRKTPPGAADGPPGT